ncbi:MAG: hypothetical protein ACTSWL_04870, partial [Promethearchaeota archaeon]
VVLKTDKKYIKKLQADNFRITDYKGKDLFALAINSSFAAIANFEQDKKVVAGIFTNNPVLVQYLSQTIMNPFIKGKKVQN